jgi:hypothetical protein
LNNFHKDAQGRFGVKSVCKKCIKIKCDANKEKINTKCRILYKENGKGKKKVYYEANKKKINARTKAYYKTNNKRLRIQNKKYREANSEKILTRAKTYQKVNKNKINLRTKKRFQTNSKLRINRSMSGYIAYSLKGNKENQHWETLIGYSLKELIKHLEKLFKPGMTWNNYGEWHIDHIIPVSVHNFTKPEHRDFKRCWALKNLQPMWAKDNLRKQAKINKHFQPSLLL